MEFYKLTNIEYDNKLFSPVLDEIAIELHFTKHHAGYCNKLNEALTTLDNFFPELNTNIDLLFFNLKKYEKQIVKKFGLSLFNKLFNNAGGYLNHEFFFSFFKPAENNMSDNLKNIFEKSFETVDNFFQKINEIGSSHFSNGWLWVYQDKDGLLKIATTKDHERLSEEKNPILIIDLWEHAYYLNYQNRRSEYLTNVLKIINWEKVESLIK